MDNTKRNTLLQFTPAICWGILICYFSLLPEQEVPSILKSTADYILHFSIYAALATLVYLGKNGFTRQSVSNRFNLQIILFCSLLGLLLEVIQEVFIPGRHFQFSDVVFNTLGILVIWPLNKWFFKTQL